MIDDIITDRLFDEFGFCNCGRPYVVAEKIIKILTNIDREGWIKVEDEDLLYIYLLDKYEYITHYTSVYASKITEKGKNLLKEVKNES